MVGVMSFFPLNELPTLFPHVVDWISCLEKQAQDSGRALTRLSLLEGKIGYFLEEIARRGA